MSGVLEENINPEVSVIMPVFNAGSFIWQAIESILNQTFRNFELIIIDDASTDNSIQVVKDIFDSRIRLITNERNVGIVGSRNKGIEVSRGEFIAMMDADDISLPKRLELQVQYMRQHPNVSAVASKLALIDAIGRPAGRWIEDENATSFEEIKKTLPIINCLGQSTMLIRKKIFDKLLYNPHHRYSEDWGLWLAMLAEGCIINKIDKVLIEYRVHSSSVSVQQNKKGIRNKILKFKFSYLNEQLRTQRFKYTDYKVVKSFIKDLVKPIVPFNLFMKAKRIYQKKPLKILRELFIFSWYYDKLKKYDHFLFFPFYHIGGAEKVHLSILNAISDAKNVIFFTDISLNSKLYNQFAEQGLAMEVSHLVGYERTKQWLFKKLKKMAENNSSLIFFGCNSFVYYQAISYLPYHSHCIDLIHAFMHPHEIGAEKWSLPVVERLNKRVVINRKVMDDLAEQYKSNNINEEMLGRVVVIENFVFVPETLSKKQNAILNIIYVGRDTLEKRVNIIGSIARECYKEMINAHFTFVGDIHSLAASDYPYCQFKGEVINELDLNEIYNSADLLLISSSREGFPMVIMEGMAHGTVPLSTNVGGISQHVHHKENGILINSMDEPEIVKGMVEWIKKLETDRNLLISLSKKAHHYALANFNDELFEKKYKQLFELN
jgi:glycosyltransferase involved in cell wall biosynthesis